MPELEYSTDALNARSAFLGVKAVVYVEGPDDECFWHEIFSRVTDESFEVESVGGAPKLDEYIAKIVTGELSGIAARDADFQRYLKRSPASPTIVYTFGHSIENSLYVAESILFLTRTMLRSTSVSLNDCEKWLDQLARDFKPLIELDLANALGNCGVPTLADNCSRFMKDSTGRSACPSKIAEHCRSATSKIPPTLVRQASMEIPDDPDAILRCFRGHFLVSAIVRFIQSQAKALKRKVNVSKDALYPAAIACLSSTLSHRHPHRAYYKQTAADAWSALGA